MPDVTSQDCWMKLNSRMCEFANSKIPIKQQSLDLFIVEALYFYPLTTNLFQCVHLKIKAEQRSRFPMQLQRGVKPLDAGHKPLYA